MKKFWLIGRMNLFLFTSFLALQFVSAFAQPGSLDPTFSGDGKLTDWTGSAAAVAIQPDGKMVVVGRGPGGGPGPIYGYDFRTARYNPDGTPDTTFGNGTGRLTTDLGGRDPGSSVLIQPDGKIVVAGPVTAEASLFGLVRYNSDGSLDSQFGGGTGIVMTPVPENCGIYSYGESAKLAIQPDGKLVGIVGYSDWDWNCQWAGFMFRHHPDGSPDTSFGSNGIVYSEGEWGSGALWSIAIQPTDGKILALGYRFITRFNTNGSVDSSFGSDGRVTIPYPSFVSSLAVQSDGKILAAGSTSTPQYDFAIYRFNANGSYDTSFGAGGLVTTQIGYFGEWVSTIAVQSDAKIVAAGVVAYSEQASDFAVARYNSNGSPDTTFGGGDGVSVIDFNNSYDSVSHMVLDRGGRAVTVGRSGGQFAIARFLSGLPEAQSPAAFDFDGDGRSDVSVFRPSDRVWYLNQSTNGFSATQFGLATDKITPADYDGDGKTDIAVYRDGAWWIRKSGDGTVETRTFGVIGDIPVPRDYTGDGRDEIAVYRNGQWWALDLSNGQASLFNFGLPTDKPVPADYDGDGRADQAVYRNGEWHINRSSQGYIVIQFGLAADRPVAADYDGDGKTDIAIYRNGEWHRFGSTTGYTVVNFGLESDVPGPADYDGDGKTDVAVFRSGTWYINRSTGGVSIQQFGLSNDAPVPAAYSGF